MIPSVLRSAVILLLHRPASYGARRARPLQRGPAAFDHPIPRRAHARVKNNGTFRRRPRIHRHGAETGGVKAIEATIKTASINPNHEKRDAHLRNFDFFDVEKYPTMTYRMKPYKKTTEAVGELTIRGVTKDITLTGNFNGVAKDLSGIMRAGFNAEGKVYREDFGMVRSKTLDGGEFVVGDQVSIRLDVECIKAKP
jgi:polyisoprenoid-binding protein YceI